MKSEPHGGSAIEPWVRENPSIHAALKNPADAYHAASGQIKSIQKAAFSTIFLGICTEFAYISGVFGYFEPLKARIYAVPEHRAAHPPGSKSRAPVNAGNRYVSPKSTFLRGACAAAMGVFNASTTGAAMLESRG